MVANSPFGTQRDRLTGTTHLPAWQIEVFRGQRFSDDRHRKPERLEATGIELHLNLADLASVDVDGGHAVDLLEQRLQVVLNLSPRHIRALR